MSDEEVEVQMEVMHTLPLTAGKRVKCVLASVTLQLHSFLLKEIRQEASRIIVYQPSFLKHAPPTLTPRANAQLIITLTNSATWHKSHDPVFFLPQCLSLR